MMPKALMFFESTCATDYGLWVISQSQCVRLAKRVSSGLLRRGENETLAQVSFSKPYAWLVGVALSLSSTVMAEEPPVDPEKTVAKKVGENLYRIGAVTVDAELKAVAFPAKVNQLVGLIEYALVTETGKVHESFLSTKVKPSDIYAGLLLLGAKMPTKVYTELAWQVDGKWKRKPIPECVGQYPLEAASELDDKVTDQSFDLKSKEWKWTGSRSRNGKLTADESGSILSLQPDMDALALVEPMVDTSRFGSHVWPKRTPKLNASVQVFLRLEPPKKTKPEPAKPKL